VDRQLPNIWLPIQELARRKGSEGERGILKLLDSTDPYIRSYLIDRLSIENNIIPYISKVRSLLLDSDSNVIIAACKAISKITDSDCADLFFKILANPDPRVLSAAIEAIISLNIKCPLLVFFKILSKSNSSSELKKVLLNAILTRTSHDNWLEVFAVFSKFPGGTFRVKACDLFLQYGSIFELELLTALKQDIDPHVRAAAFRAVSHFDKIV